MLQVGSFRSANMDSSRSLAEQLQLFGSHRTEQQPNKQLPVDVDAANKQSPEQAHLGKESQSMQELLFSTKNLF